MSSCKETANSGNDAVVSNKTVDINDLLENSSLSTESNEDDEVSVVAVVNRPTDGASSQIGPFADNRPICECDTIKKLMANTDARYLLSLLPDMAEMNPKQKYAFKNRIYQLISRVLSGDSIDVDF